MKLKATIGIVVIRESVIAWVIGTPMKEVNDGTRTIPPEIPRNPEIRPVNNPIDKRGKMAGAIKEEPVWFSFRRPIIWIPINKRTKENNATI